VITFISTIERDDRKNTLDMDSDDRKEYGHHRKEASACPPFSTKVS
jgi:hypothetical protein